MAQLRAVRLHPLFNTRSEAQSHIHCSKMLSIPDSAAMASVETMALSETALAAQEEHAEHMLQVRVLFPCTVVCVCVVSLHCVMMCCTVLYCAVLCCAVLCCAVWVTLRFVFNLHPLSAVYLLATRHSWRSNDGPGRWSPPPTTTPSSCSCAASGSPCAFSAKTCVCCSSRSLGAGRWALGAGRWALGAGRCL